MKHTNKLHVIVFIGLFTIIFGALIFIIFDITKGESYPVQMTTYTIVSKDKQTIRHKRENGSTKITNRYYIELSNDKKYLVSLWTYNSHNAGESIAVKTQLTQGKWTHHIYSQEEVMW